MKEIEVKAKLKDIDSVIKKIKSLGCELSDPITQKDIIYLKNGVDFPSFGMGDIVLRLRNNNEKIIFTFKKQLETELSSIEHEVEVSNLKEADEIIKQLGFYEIIRVNKVRREAKYNDMTICIDEVEELGYFIEVEKLTENGETFKIQEELMKFLIELGVNKKDRVERGYDTLMYYKDE